MDQVHAPDNTYDFSNRHIAFPASQLSPFSFSFGAALIGVILASVSVESLDIVPF